MDIIVINQVRRDLSILNRICLTIYATNQSQSQRTLHNFSSTIIYLGLCFKSQKCKTTVITWLNEMWQTQNSHNILCLYLRFDSYTHLFTDEALPNCTRDALDSHKHQGGDAIKPESH